MNEQLSLDRLRWLLRADLAAGYRSLLTVSGTLAGLMLITSLTSVDGTGATQGFFMSWFGGMLYVWGTIASSRAFPELHDKTRNGAYLLMPASALEKTLARLLAVTVGLAVYLLIFTAVVSLLVAAVHGLFLDGAPGLFNPFDPELGPLVAGYLFLQSFFFLGAAWFRRRHFIKTTLVLTLVGIGLALFTILTLGMVFSPDSMSVPLQSAETLTAAFGILLPLGCWTIAWMRVREAQVSDGV